MLKGEKHIPCRCARDFSRMSRLFQPPTPKQLIIIGSQIIFLMRTTLWRTTNSEGRVLWAVEGGWPESTGRYAPLQEPVIANSFVKFFWNFFRIKCNAVVGWGVATNDCFTPIPTAESDKFVIASIIEQTNELEIFNWKQNPKHVIWTRQKNIKNIP